MSEVVVTDGDKTADFGRAPDAIFFGGPIVTVAPGPPQVDALAVKDGRITAVGSEPHVVALRGPGTEMIDLAGRALLPAFVAPHGYPMQTAGIVTPAVDLRPTAVSNSAGVVRQLSRATSVVPEGRPILLYGVEMLLQRDLRFPTRAQLDVLAPNHPVVMLANGGRAAFANSAALKLAGLPVGNANREGRHAHRSHLGESTGEVLDPQGIVALTTPFADSVLPQLRGNLRRTYAGLAAAGIATAAEHGYSVDMADCFASIAREPDCKVRVRAYEIGTAASSVTVDDAAGPFPTADVMFGKIGVSLWIDGSPWAGEMDATFPYLTTPTTLRMGLRPQHRGSMKVTPAALERMIGGIAEQGWQLSCHVHGDGAADAVLDVFERVRSTRDLRPRLEHGGAMRPDQFARGARLGLSASLLMDDVHYWGDVLVDALLGEHRGTRWMAARSAVDAGMRISLHNDGAIGPLSPLTSIRTAVTRVANGSGRVMAADERIGIDDALKAHTLSAAWQLHLDHEIGSLSPGKYADLVVLSANPRTVRPETLGDIAVEATYLMGRQTHGAPLSGSRQRTAT